MENIQEIDKWNLKHIFGKPSSEEMLFWEKKNGGSVLKYIKISLQNFVEIKLNMLAYGSANNLYHYFIIMLNI